MVEYFSRELIRAAWTGMMMKTPKSSNTEEGGDFNTSEQQIRKEHLCLHTCCYWEPKGVPVDGPGLEAVASQGPSQPALEAVASPGL